MPNFRTHHPIRKQGRKVCAKYGSYLKTLRSDFVFRCGYCNDPDRFRIRSFTIDHFVPRNPSGWAHTIPDNHYYNLVYSCRYCNSAKLNKWPTQDPLKHNDGKVGFIDPCDVSYANLFERTNVGAIKPLNPADPLSNWMYSELNLWQPIHERMWKLEQIKTESERLKNLITASQAGPLKDQLQTLHYQILQELEEVQSAIFIENN